jgi:hypothetical protein
MWPLSFLAPAFLLGVMAAVVPIVLHLRRHEAAPPLPFSSVRFLRRAPVAERRRRRLRDLVLLALRVAAVGLLAGAFARPYLVAGPMGGDPVTVVAVDTSFSLGAPGQMARARRLAREAVARVPRGERLALIAFSDTADVVVAPTADRAAVLAAIDRLEAGFGATRYAQALAKAGTVVGGAAGRIVVVTDLQRAGWDPADEGAVPEQATVEVVDVGMPAGNLAVTAIRPETTGAIATVLNAGAAPRPVRATLAIDGRPVATVTATAPPGVATEVRFPIPLPRAGSASVTVEDAEGAAADNTRYLVLEPPEPSRVLLVTVRGDAMREAFYLERALLAGGDARRIVPDTVAASAVATLAADSLRAATVVIVLATRGLDRRGQERLSAYVREGGGLLVAAGPFVERAAVADLLGLSAEAEREGSSEQTVSEVSLAPLDPRHPVFRPFGTLASNVTQARFRRTRQMAPVGDGTVIARFSDGGDALVEYRRGRGRVLLFNSDLNHEWNDFPLHPMFAPFVHELIRHLGRPRREAHEWLVSELPPGLPARPGLVRLTTTGGWVAVNVDVRESDLTRMSADEFQAAVARTKRAATQSTSSDASDREARQRLWWYALLGATVALAIEGVVGRRAV